MMRSSDSYAALEAFGGGLIGSDRNDAKDGRFGRYVLGLRFCRLFNMVDDEHLDRASLGFQFQAQLLVEVFQKFWGRLLAVQVRTRNLSNRPVEGEIIGAGESGPIENSAVEVVHLR